MNIAEKCICELSMTLMLHSVGPLNDKIIDLHKSKVKLLLYCHAGTEGKRSIASTHSWPQHLMGGEWSVSCPGCALPLYPLYRKLGGPQLVWTQRLEERSFASAEEWTPVVQSVDRHYIDWATSPPNGSSCNVKIKGKEIKVQWNPCPSFCMNCFPASITHCF
jgi:hypothetical protein